MEESRNKGSGAQMKGCLWKNAKAKSAEFRRRSYDRTVENEDAVCRWVTGGQGRKVPKSLVTSLNIIYEYRAFIKPS